MKAKTYMLKAQIILETLLHAGGRGGNIQLNGGTAFSMSDSVRRDASLKSLSAVRSLV